VRFHDYRHGRAKVSKASSFATTTALYFLLSIARTFAMLVEFMTTLQQASQSTLVPTGNHYSLILFESWLMNEIAWYLLETREDNEYYCYRALFVKTYRRVALSEISLLQNQKIRITNAII